MKEQFNRDKDLAGKVLDLYFKYCELRLPFKIGDEYEIHEFDLDFLSSRVMSICDNYQYNKPIEVELNNLQMFTAHLSFHWDEITRIQLWFEVSDERLGKVKVKELVDKVVNKEKLYLVETLKSIKLTYVVGSEKVELVMNKSRDNSK